MFRPERGEIEGDVSYLQTRRPRQRWPTSATQYDRVRAWAAPGLGRPVQLIRARRVDRGRPCAAGPSAGRWLLELKIGAVLWDEEVLSYSRFGCPGPDFRTDSDHLHEDALHEARRRIGRAAEARSCGNGCRVRSAMRSGDLFLHQGHCVRGLYSRSRGTEGTGYRFYQFVPTYTIPQGPYNNGRFGRGRW